MALLGRYTGELGHTAPVLVAGASMHTAAPPVQISFGKPPKPRTLWSPSSEVKCVRLMWFEDGPQRGGRSQMY